MDEVSRVLLMMGPVGRPLEDISGADPDDSWWQLDGYRVVSGTRVSVTPEQWTVERIGRHVYTFCLDDD